MLGLMTKRLLCRKFLKCFVKENRSFKGTGINSVRVLGIETSCDDTGCAIVDDNGTILGEFLESQQDIHTEHGGILPPLARDLHKENIEKVVNHTLCAAKLNLAEVDAIAVTVKPGLPLSLLVGMHYGKMLAVRADKPFIPIHHMEAHALTVRMTEKVKFPFMVLLISGGHCLLSVARSVDNFLLLGKTLDDAPGEALDKIARRLKLTHMKKWRGMSGGAALCMAGESGDPEAFPVAEPLLRHKDCNFSFAGVKNSARSLIIQHEQENGVEGDAVIPRLGDMCASIRWAIAKHLARRLFRGFEFVHLNKLIPPDNQVMVVSGGVAASPYFRSVLDWVCRRSGYKLLAPPAHLCTDNGAMIAWNGVEKLLAHIPPCSVNLLHTIDIEPKCPFGEDISKSVQNAGIKSTRLSIEQLITGN